MAGDARRLVEHGPESVGDAFLVHEVRSSLLEKLQLVRAEARQRIAEIHGGAAQLRRPGQIHERRTLLRGHRLLGAAGEKNDCCHNDRTSGHAFLLTALPIAPAQLGTHPRRNACDDSHAVSKFPKLIAYTRLPSKMTTLSRGSRVVRRPSPRPTHTQ